MARGPGRPGSGGSMKYLAAVVIVAVAAAAAISAWVVLAPGSQPSVNQVIYDQDCDGLKTLFISDPGRALDIFCNLSRGCIMLKVFMNAPAPTQTVMEQNARLVTLGAKCAFPDFLWPRR